MTVLSAVAEADIPDAWVGAGVLRSLVWDERIGTELEPDSAADVDVAFFDSADLSPERDAEIKSRLDRLLPGVRWDPVNQAAVHLWYPDHVSRSFGVTVEPLQSSIDGIATWPETATAVGVRLAGADLQVAAPFGLDDLLDGVWRWNPRRAPYETFQQRLRAKRPAERWPALRVIIDR